MKRFFAVAALLISALCGFSAEPVSTDFVRPFPIVMYSTNNAMPKVRELAQRISKSFGLSEAMPSNHNPACCVWLEVTRWTPNPGMPGYIVVHQGGGTLITASTPEQLEVAVARFINSARVRSGQKEAPVGLMTNYKLVK